MSGPGFGFSFGDFVQAIRLLDDVRRALKDTGGAVDEYKNVLLELQQLEIVLEHIGVWKAQFCAINIQLSVPSILVVIKPNSIITYH